MIINNLGGGIGNQMFQYAMGKSLSLRNNIPILYSDTFDQYDYNFPKITEVFDLIDSSCTNLIKSLWVFLELQSTLFASAVISQIN